MALRICNVLLLTLVFVVAVPPALALASTADAAPEPAKPSVLDKAVTHGRVTVSAQPSADDLRLIKAQGYDRIVNVRTQAEMDDRAQVPFDEAALAEELGLDYVHLPIGGEAHPWRPEVVDGLASALAGGESRVFLHCTVGARASLVYAAYAVRHLGVDPDVALREAEAFGVWPLPLERLSGVKLKVVRAEAEDEEAVAD